MKNGIFYLTYNGYYNHTTGIGTQTKLFLSGISSCYERFRSSYGDFEINLVVPKFDKTVDGYEESHIIYADTIIDNYGGEVYVCDSAMEKGEDGFWTVDNWERITPSAASIVCNEARKYRRSLVLAVDPPYLSVPRYIELENRDRKLCIESVILLYTSSYIHDKRNICYRKLAWEYNGIASARIQSNIYIGAICRFMTDHLIEYYGADKESFVPSHSSLLLEENTNKEIEGDEICCILDKYGIPREKDIILSFGRASWIKGFDVLVKSIAGIKKDIHLVLIASPFEIDPSVYENAIQQNCSNGYTLVTEFSRDLPMVLCQHRRCRIVVCPSRGEPFSNIPLEVALWARNGGPVVLASDVDGFLEQITDGYNGFLFNVGSAEDLANRINIIMQMTDRELSTIRMNAYERVINERSFLNNFDSLLRALWE
jgi:D-inositol-3-phosphate glycosyltransferase